MNNRLTDLHARLGVLLQKIMKETDQEDYDKLAAEMWQVLEEIERVRSKPALAEKPAA